MEATNAKGNSGGMGEGALSHIKVLDLSQEIAGPYCTRLMAGLGAEVIKVEKPMEGDVARRIGPFFQNDPHPEKSGLFLYLNANKKGVTLNLNTKTGVEIFKKLTKHANLVVESFEPGTLGTLGLEYEVLEKINPTLVMASITNFGQTGPYRNYKATELIFYAISGLMYLTGEQEWEPLKLGGSLAQYVAGQRAFVASLGALYYQQASGVGQQVDISIMESAAATLEWQVPPYTYKEYLATRTGNLNRKGNPHGIFPCRNGYVALSLLPGKLDALARLTGIQEFLEPRFATPALRVKNRKEFDALLQLWLTERKKEELMHVFQESQLVGGYVRDMQEVVNCPQMGERGFFAHVAHPFTGEITYPTTPFRLQETPWKVGRAPLLGEHNSEIYGRILDYKDEDLMRLRERGII